MTPEQLDDNEVQAAVERRQLEARYAGTSEQMSADINAVLEHLATVTRERDKLRHKLYRPGVLRCAKCNFRLISSVLNADTGAIYAQETTEHCPNDGAPMWRVSWEEECRASDKWGDDILARATLAEAQRDEAVGALEQSAARFRHYEKLHAEKETPDGDAKAQSNADMAEVCEGVISRIKSSRGAGG